MAEEWFEVVTAGAPDTPMAWEARIGRGQARLLQGDLLGAALEWQAVVSSPGVPDSLAKVASNRLNGLAAADAPPPLEEQQ
jgi:hypothetical protein